VNDAESLNTITQQVRNGNLTAVLQRYEDEIRHPLRGALSGDLIRSLLIQAQKVKVDGELAMSALDKVHRINCSFLDQTN
jgi:nuclear control of ATPase protein 2